MRSTSAVVQVNTSSTCPLAPDYKSCRDNAVEYFVIMVGVDQSSPAVNVRDSRGNKWKRRIVRSIGAYRHAHPPPNLGSFQTFEDDG